jgi:hypothetical protein
MATNAISIRRPSDRNLYLIAAVGFPLLVLIGYFRSYYFSAFFDAPVMSTLVHAHGLVMSAWVVFFTVQIALIRTRNVKLHMTMGFVGIALAAIVVVVGMATAYTSQLILHRAPAGIDPYSFFLIPVADMVGFVAFFSAAIYYRKRPAEHKSLMLMTAINFLPAAVSRIPVVPDKYAIFWFLGVPDVLALAFFGWYTWRHRKVNKVFAVALGLLIASHPLKIMLMGTEPWVRFAGWLASFS